MNSKSSLIHRINGENYVLMDYMVMSSTTNHIKRQFKKHGIIIRGIKEAKQGGFFRSGYVVIECLVPEKKVSIFNDMQ